MTIVLLIVSAALHELGHAIAAVALGLRIMRAGVNWNGST